MENVLYPDASSHVEDCIITPEELYIHLIFFIKKILQIYLLNRTGLVWLVLWRRRVRPYGFRMSELG